MGNAINIIAATCVLILLVLLLRRLFWKKCNPNLLYFLWIFVALRILVPVHIPYMVSPEMERHWDFIQSAGILFMPVSEQETVETNMSAPASDIAGDIAGAPASGVALADAPANAMSDRDPEGGVNLEDPSIYSSKSPFSLKKILLPIWLCGCILCAAYFLLVNICTFRNIVKKQIGKVNKTVKVYMVEGYNCLVGVWKPHIFISPQVAENPAYRKYVLMHEMEHYKVKDNFWLLVRTICLSIQWFNPLVWVAYFKAQEDCELACDYRVLSKLEQEEKTPMQIPYCIFWRRVPKRHIWRLPWEKQVTKSGLTVFTRNGITGDLDFYAALCVLQPYWHSCRSLSAGQRCRMTAECRMRKHLRT